MSVSHELCGCQIQSESGGDISALAWELGRLLQILYPRQCFAQVVSSGASLNDTGSQVKAGSTHCAFFGLAVVGCKAR